MIAETRKLADEYRQRKAEGKKPTAAQRKAHRAILEAAILDQLRDCTPNFFEEMFGISRSHRHNWETRYQFPCGRGRKSIDAIEVIMQIKDLIRANARYLGTGAAPGTGQSDDDIDINEAKRLEAISRRQKTDRQREKIELELKSLKRELIPAEDVRETFDTICNTWCRIAKKLRDFGHQDAWDIVESGLSEARAQFERDCRLVNENATPAENNDEESNAANTAVTDP